MLRKTCACVGLYKDHTNILCPTRGGASMLSYRLGRYFAQKGRIGSIFGHRTRVD